MALADALGIPDSTTRLYLRRYEVFIPSVGEGRRRRYRAEALDVLKFVVELSQAGQTPDMIMDAMKGRFPINSKVQHVQQQQVLQHQPSVAEASQMLSSLVANEIGPYLSAVLDELRELRQEVAELRGQLAEQRPQEEQQEPQPPGDATPSVIDQLQRPEPERPPRPWWKFWGE